MAESHAFNELIGMLRSAQGKMLTLSNGQAVTGEWDKAQVLLNAARQVNELISSISSETPPPNFNSQSTNRTSRPSKLPHYCVEEDRLVKIGQSRDGGTYEHRVTKRNYDLVLERLRMFARDSNFFETQDLIDRCDIPKHEPGIVVNVLAEQGLIVPLRRGRWSFADAASFAASVGNAWSKLPRY